MDVNRNWYIVYTRCGNEKKVASLLEKKGLEAYCPLKKGTRHQMMYNRKLVAEALFTCFVFVKASEAEQALIRETEGFLNFVFWRSSPAVTSSDEIDTIRRFLVEYDHVSIEKTEVAQNDKVRILNGPLVLWEGNVVEVMTDTVKILLPSLGYSLVAEIRKDNAINKAHLQYNTKNVI